MNRRRDQQSSRDGEPVDLGAVGHDDAFISDLAVGRPTPINDDAEYQLAAMITAWRADTLAAPIPAEPTLAQIDAAVAVRDGRGSMSRRLRIVSGAAAILAVFGAGLMVMSEGAEPGDALWSVKQVVFAEQARQTQARVNVEDNLDAAKVAFETGDEEMARTYISRAESELGPVGDADTIAGLRNRIADLRKSEDPKPDDPRMTAMTTKPSGPTDAQDSSDPTSSETDDPSDTTTGPSKPSTSPSSPSTRPSESDSSRESVEPTSPASASLTLLERPAPR
ncbi:anti-sigma-D factor RsdA [Gordonia humi]|uniref:Anti-sigma-D factor RsdA sigma factor binding region domain-containing protein n=1 Tax=Gordonia humi TaxID=686429 RepID=A0A840EZ38_9ACTN|nr:anti-sigma-D factor RsdA [Gordonia humi]MBB4135578.1 hypothetical protein [Gordonia humi]